MVANALPDLPAADAAARESLTNDYLKSVSSGGPDARIDALRGLAEVKAVFAASWIVGRLDDNDARVRDAALRALGSMGDAKGFEAAQRLLSDPAPEVRRAAVWTYAKLAPKNADLAPLQPLLKDADLSVVREALAALLQKKGDAAKQLASGLFTPFVRRWMAVGPFPNKENKAFAATFPPEQGLQLDAQYDGDGGRVGWKEIVSETDEVMLEKHLADRTEVAAYAAAAVESKEACDVLLLLGSDDDVKVWVNGELVHLKQTGRAVRKDNDIARAKLRKGVNSVLFKVVNGSGPWGLCLRFAVPRGADALSFPEPRTALAPVRKDLLQKQALTGGDPVAGEAVFRGGKTNCERCHAVKGAGNRVGPELTGIGAKYPREHLIESVLYPSRKLSQGFQAVTIVTTDERTLSGIVASETPVQVTLVGSDGVPVTVPVSEIATRHPQPVSIMPEGLETALSDEEFVDLIAFLESLR
jgi:putative heme-binding domain-containing protein